MRAWSATVVAPGFSSRRCFPASSTRTACAAWSLVRVHTMIASTSSLAKSSSSVRSRTAGSSAPTRSRVARPRADATATSSTDGLRIAHAACTAEMNPVPAMPSRTGSKSSLIVARTLPRMPLYTVRVGRSITIFDVAHEAGVSKSTVSNVVRGVDEVSDETRQRVLAVIEKLNYKPNGIARQFVKRRTTMIGVLVGDLGNAYHAHLAQVVERALFRRGHTAMFCNIEGDEELAIAGVDALLEQRVAGFVFLALIERTPQLAASLRRTDVPIVAIGLRQEWSDSVGPRDREGGRLAARHLLDLGHRRIGYVRTAAGRGQRRPCPPRRLRGGAARRRRRAGGGAVVGAGLGDDPRRPPADAAARRAQRSRGADGRLRLERPRRDRADRGLRGGRDRRPRATSRSSASTTSPWRAWAASP